MSATSDSAASDGVTSDSVTSDSEIAFLNILDPAFRVDTPEVRAAADAGWWARTPIGIAVLRYQECQELLRERRLRQGSLDALAAYGVTSGPFVDWLRATLVTAEGEPHQRLRRLVSAAFTQRRVSPSEDLISALIAAETDGQRLTGEELLAMVSGLVFAGQDTTRNQLGLAVLTFIRHPEQWRLLARRPELVSTAVEELMRVDPVVPVLGRLATEDFTFRGLDIPAGTHVSLFVATANREAATFGDAPFDITAQRSTHLSLGSGIHYCLGNWLARIELREALPILATRFGEIALDGPVTSRPHIGVTGPVTLPLRFGI